MTLLKTAFAEEEKKATLFSVEFISKSSDQAKDFKQLLDAIQKSHDGVC